MTRALVAFVALAGCYSAPQPDCGFVCGPGGACPDDYTCASDHHCHRNGAPASLTCGTPPEDAAQDSPSDSPRPQIVFVTPADGATGVAVDALVQAASDQVLQGSPDLTLAAFPGAPVPGSARFIDSGMAIELTPDAQLSPNEHYTATISASVIGQNAIPLGPYEWSFDTGADTVVPHLQRSIPADHDTGVAVTTGIRVTFDETVVGVDATSFTATDGATSVVGTIATITPRIFELRPASSLSHGSTITVALSGAIMDTSGNPFAPASFTFTTQ